MTLGLGEAESMTRHRVRWSQPLDIGQGIAYDLGVKQGGASPRHRARWSLRPWCRARRSLRILGSVRAVVAPLTTRMN
jgi:hypothetical protein